jgi:hypothetical protein
MGPSTLIHTSIYLSHDATIPAYEKLPGLKVFLLWAVRSPSKLGGITDNNHDQPLFSGYIQVEPAQGGLRKFPGLRSVTL